MNIEQVDEDIVATSKEVCNDPCLRGNGEFVECTECGAPDGFCDCANDVEFKRKYYQQGMMAERYADKWISVDDRLPNITDEDDCKFLIWGCKFGDVKENKQGHEMLAYWMNNKWMDTDLIDEININPQYWEVTHWMPLPQPPKI